MSILVLFLTVQNQKTFYCISHQNNFEQLHIVAKSYTRAKMFKKNIRGRLEI